MTTWLGQTRRAGCRRRERTPALSCDGRLGAALPASGSWLLQHAARGGWDARARSVCESDSLGRRPAGLLLAGSLACWLALTATATATAAFPRKPSGLGRMGVKVLASLCALGTCEPFQCPARGRWTVSDTGQSAGGGGSSRPYTPSGWEEWGGRRVIGPGLTKQNSERICECQRPVAVNSGQMAVDTPPTSPLTLGLSM